MNLDSLRLLELTKVHLGAIQLLSLANDFSTHVDFFFYTDPNSIKRILPLYLLYII